MLLQDWRTDPILQLRQGAEARNGESLEAAIQRRVADSGSEWLLIGALPAVKTTSVDRAALRWAASPF